MQYQKIWTPSSTLVDNKVIYMVTDHATLTEDAEGQPAYHLAMSLKGMLELAMIMGREIT